MAVDYTNQFGLLRPAENSASVETFAQRYRSLSDDVFLGRKNRLVQAEAEAAKKYMDLLMEANRLRELERMRAGPSNCKRTRSEMSTNSESTEHAASFQRIFDETRLFRVEQARLANMLLFENGCKREPVPFLKGELPQHLPVLKRADDVRRLADDELDEYLYGYGISMAPEAEDDKVQKLIDFLRIELI